MSRKTKTLANPTLSSLGTALEDVVPAENAIVAIELYVKNFPTYTEAQLQLMLSSLASFFPYKDIKSIYAGIAATPWN
jgi:hypothetical protein